MKRYLLLAIFALLALAGCSRDMDPFVGGPGVRMNVNGKKYVMHGRSNSNYLTKSLDAAPYSVSLNVTMTGLDASFDFSLSMSESSAPVAGRQYSCTASISQGSDVIPMTGSIEFTRLPGDTPTVEGLFELSGTGADGTAYKVTHGFFRMK